MQKKTERPLWKPIVIDIFLLHNDRHYMKNYEDSIKKKTLSDMRTTPVSRRKKIEYWNLFYQSLFFLAVDNSHYGGMVKNIIPAGGFRRLSLFEGA